MSKRRDLSLFFSSRRRHTRFDCDWSSDVCSSDLSSANGGATWNSPTALTGAMQLAWLPTSQNGLMVGDYIATAFVNGVPHGVFAVAQATSGGVFNETIYTGQGLSASAAGRQLSSAHDL